MEQLAQSIEIEGGDKYEILSESDKENSHPHTHAHAHTYPLGFRSLGAVGRVLNLQQSCSDDRLSRNRTESLLTRVHERSEQLRQLFQLPKGESLVDEFHCALAKTFLLQGRLYIFERYVCFHTNIFGIVKKKVISMEEVSQISQRRLYGFPNSIQIVHGPNNKTEFFTSFLSRDEAFHLLYTTWKQSRLRFSNSNSNSGSTNSKDFETGGEEEEEDVDEDLEEEEEEQLEISKYPTNQTRISRSSTDLVQQTEDFLEEDVWSVRENNPPERETHMQIIFQNELQMNTTQFMQQILSDSSNFFYDYHDKRGDRNLKIQPWKNDQMFGHARELIFVSPVKNRIGPAETSCSQIQRASFYKDSYLVFETSQIMTDIPFGDHFKVETRWDLENIDENRCKVTVFCHIPFFKRTFARRIIENSVVKEVKEGSRIFFELVQEKISIQDNLMHQQQQLQLQKDKVFQEPNQVPFAERQLSVQFEKGESQTLKQNFDGPEVNNNNNILLQQYQQKYYQRSIIYKINAFAKENGLQIIIVLAIFALFFWVFDEVFLRNREGQLLPQEMILQNMQILQKEIQIAQQRMDLITKQVALANQQFLLINQNQYLN